MNLGIAGVLTRAFIASPLTPLFLIASFALGLVALVTLPREEEPQISVPMVDIHVEANGLKAEDAVKLVTEPLEAIVKSIDGVEHVYSKTLDDGALVTARFLVGTSADAAKTADPRRVVASVDAAGLTVQADGRRLAVDLVDDTTYDLIRDHVAGAGVGLVRMERSRHRMSEIFATTRGAADVAPTR
jgi:multidrug efflux pump subunit AcrB